MGAAFASGVSELIEDLRQREDRLALLLSVLIGALVGLIVVAFVLLTGRLAAQMYPPGGAGWRRILVPTFGSLLTGYLLFRYFPDARGGGIPKTRAAIFMASRDCVATFVPDEPLALFLRVPEQ